MDCRPLQIYIQGFPPVATQLDASSCVVAAGKLGGSRSQLEETTELPEEAQTECDVSRTLNGSLGRQH